MLDFLRLFKRFSVLMMSTISCNLLLASFGASSSTVRFHPFGCALKRYDSASIHILYANARSSARHRLHCSTCCVKSSSSACSGPNFRGQILFVPTFVPRFMTTRHLVLSNFCSFCCSTFATHTSNRSRIFNFVTIRHLVLNPISSPVVPIIAPISDTFVLFTSLLPSSTDNTHIVKPPNIEMLPPCVVGQEPAASMATVLPPAPMQDQSTNLCSSRSTTSLRQSSCQRDPNSCPTTLCILDRFVFPVCLRAPPFREIPFFPCSCSCCLPFARIALLLLLLPLSCPCLCLLPGLAFGFVVRARPSTRLIVLHVFSFLSTISRHVAVNSTP